MSIANNLISNMGWNYPININNNNIQSSKKSTDLIPDIRLNLWQYLEIKDFQSLLLTCKTATITLSLFDLPQIALHMNCDIDINAIHNLREERIQLLELEKNKNSPNNQNKKPIVTTKSFFYNMIITCSKIKMAISNAHFINCTFLLKLPALTGKTLNIQKNVFINLENQINVFFKEDASLISIINTYKINPTSEKYALKQFLVLIGEEIIKEINSATENKDLLPLAELVKNKKLQELFIKSNNNLDQLLKNIVKYPKKSKKKNDKPILNDSRQKILLGLHALTSDFNVPLEKMVNLSFNILHNVIASPKQIKDILITCKKPLDLTPYVNDEALSVSWLSGNITLYTSLVKANLISFETILQERKISGAGQLSSDYLIDLLMNLTPEQQEIAQKEPMFLHALCDNKETYIDPLINEFDFDVTLLFNTTEKDRLFFLVNIVPLMKFFRKQLLDVNELFLEDHLAVTHALLLDPESCFQLMLFWKVKKSTNLFKLFQNDLDKLKYAFQHADKLIKNVNLNDFRKNFKDIAPRFQSRIENPKIPPYYSHKKRYKIRKGRCKKFTPYYVFLDDNNSPENAKAKIPAQITGPDENNVKSKKRKQNPDYFQPPQFNSNLNLPINDNHMTVVSSSSISTQPQYVSVTASDLLAHSLFFYPHSIVPIQTIGTTSTTSTSTTSSTISTSNTENQELENQPDTAFLPVEFDDKESLVDRESPIHELEDSDEEMEEEEDHFSDYPEVLSDSDIPVQKNKRIKLN